MPAARRTSWHSGDRRWLEAGPSGRQFHVRQLKDMKVKMLIELFTRGIMTQYAELCG